MKHLKVLFLVLTCFALAACSPRVAQPPPLEEVEPQLEDTSADSLGGPSVGGDLSGSGIDNWDNAFSGEREIASRPSGDWASDSNLETVYFDYDKYDLSEEARRALMNNADYLKRNPNMRVLIEGHCDERGTEQYNQALGENRALAVREYLVQLGISPSRIDIISYGELRPAVMGSGESAWKFNRRADFKVAQ